MNSLNKTQTAVFTLLLHLLLPGDHNTRIYLCKTQICYQNKLFQSIAKVLHDLSEVRATAEKTVKGTTEQTQSSDPTSFFRFPDLGLRHHGELSPSCHPTTKEVSVIANCIRADNQTSSALQNNRVITPLKNILIRYTVLFKARCYYNIQIHLILVVTHLFIFILSCLVSVKRCVTIFNRHFVSGQMQQLFHWCRKSICILDNKVYTHNKRLKSCFTLCNHTHCNRMES